jgi:uncharacterized protein YbaP (TraB family)
MAKPIRLLCAALALCLAPLPALASPPVWTIHDKDSTIVLFGSVHILKPDTDWRPKALSEALAKADDLWFEIPLDDAAQLEATQAAVHSGLLPDGQSLSGLLDPKDRGRLAALAVKLNLPLPSLDRLQPWLADATLSDTLLAQQGAMADAGVEQTLQHEMPASVTRHAFETPAGQIGMLASASRAAQIASLKDTLKSASDDPKEFARLVQMWMKGDAKGLDKEAVEELRHVSPELYDIMIKRRNTAWVDQIIARLNGSGETVMVVGVGHLVGPDSVPNMLRARGIKVDGP